MLRITWRYLLKIDFRFFTRRYESKCFRVRCGNLNLVSIPDRQAWKYDSERRSVFRTSCCPEEDTQEDEATEVSPWSGVLGRRRENGSARQTAARHLHIRECPTWILKSKPKIPELLQLLGAGAQGIRKLPRVRKHILVSCPISSCLHPDLCLASVYSHLQCSREAPEECG